MSSLIESPGRRRNRTVFRNIQILQILSYRLPPAGIVSILHRISGASMFLLMPLSLWLFELSLTSETSFNRLVGFIAHPLSKLVVLGLCWALFHHVAAGLRYLALDLHLGITRDASRKSALAVFAISIPLTLITAVLLFGGV